MEFDGLKLKVYKWGTGPKKVLLLHGWESNSFRWKRFVNRFPKDKYTLYALDAPAHGQSEGKRANVPIYGEAIHQFLLLHGDVAYLVCHSFAGFAALYMLHKVPDAAVKKIVCLGVPGAIQPYFKYFIELLGLSENCLHNIENHFKKVIDIDLDDFTSAHFAKNVSAQGLIVHDTDDKDVELRYAKMLHEAWPDSTLWITEGFGHKLTQPEVVEKVFEFIDG